MLRWLVAAMVPAGLLSATTTFLATDLISAPLLWIWPLGIYLASMTVAFSARGRRLLGPIERLVPTAATLLWIPFVLPVGWPVVVLLAIEFGAFGVLATAIHGRLALDRPDERHLTAFYLVLSAGGVLATGLVALAAPLLFSTVLEYPLLIAAATVVLAMLARPESSGDASGARGVLLGIGRRLVPYAVIAGVLYAIVATGSSGVVVGVIGGLLAVGALIVAGARTYGALAVLTTATIAVSPRPRFQQPPPPDADVLRRHGGEGCGRGRCACALLGYDAPWPPVPGRQARQPDDLLRRGGPGW